MSNGTRGALIAATVLAMVSVARRRHGSRGIQGPMRYVRGEGYVQSGPVSLDIVLRAVREADADPERIVLYHSGDASVASQIHQEGLSPHMGQWVEQALAGATDDLELLQEIRQGQGQSISYLSASPDWVTVKAARALGTFIEKMRRQDIVEHGHLAIFILDRDDSDIVRASNLMQDQFETLSGERLKWYQTSLYQQADPYTGLGARENVPFGVETGDYITAEPLSPDYTLTGEALIGFLSAKKTLPLWWQKGESQ